MPMHSPPPVHCHPPSHHCGVQHTLRAGSCHRPRLQHARSSAACGGKRPFFDVIEVVSRVDMFALHPLPVDIYIHQCIGVNFHSLRHMMYFAISDSCRFHGAMSDAEVRALAACLASNTALKELESGWVSVRLNCGSARPSSFTSLPVAVADSARHGTYTSVAMYSIIVHHAQRKYVAGVVEGKLTAASAGAAFGLKEPARWQPPSPRTPP